MLQNLPERKVVNDVLRSEYSLYQKDLVREATDIFIEDYFDTELIDRGYDSTFMLIRVHNNILSIVYRNIDGAVGCNLNLIGKSYGKKID